MSHGFRRTSSQEKHHFAEISHVFPGRPTWPTFGPRGVAKPGEEGGEDRVRTPQFATCRVSRERGGKATMMSAENTPVDPNRLTLEQAAKLLSAAAKLRVPVDQITADLEAGAPQNPDGTMNLMHYAAWLVKEMGRG